MKFRSWFKKTGEIDIGKGTTQELSHWSNIIEKTAKELCNDPECKRIQFKIDENGKAQINANDSEAMDCILKSFERHKNSIPLTTQTVLDQTIKHYQQNRGKSQSN